MEATAGDVHDDVLCADVQCNPRSNSELKNGVVRRWYPYAESRSRRMQSTVTSSTFCAVIARSLVNQ